MATSVVANTAKFLSRYADLLGLIAIIPPLAHVKFSKLIELQQQTAEASDSKKKTDTSCLPSAAALLLFAAAELFAKVELFTPGDATLKRAVGEALRAQQSSQGTGVNGMVSIVGKLLEHTDIFDCVRFITTVAGLLSLCGTVALRLDDVDTRGSMNPLKVAIHTTRHVLTGVLSPRVFFVLAVCATFICGNWTALGKLVKRKVATDIIAALPPVLRAIAATMVALQASYSGPIPIFASVHGAAAAARAAHLFVYERLSIEDIVVSGGANAVFEGTKAVMSARCNLAMEAWVLLVLLPCALSHSRLRRLALPVLLMPVAMILQGGPRAEPLMSQLEEVTRGLTFGVGGVAILMVFMGGMSTMLAVLGLMQVLVRLHNLEKIRY